MRRTAFMASEVQRNQGLPERHDLVVVLAICDRGPLGGGQRASLDTRPICQDLPRLDRPQVTINHAPALRTYRRDSLISECRAVTILFDSLLKHLEDSTGLPGRRTLRLHADVDLAIIISGSPGGHLESRTARKAKQVYPDISEGPACLSNARHQWLGHSMERVKAFDLGCFGLKLLLSHHQPLPTTSPAGQDEHNASGASSKGLPRKAENRPSWSSNLEKPRIVSSKEPGLPTAGFFKVLVKRVAQFNTTGHNRQPSVGAVPHY